MLWKTYKMARDAYQSFAQNCTDLAVLEGLVDRHVREMQALQRQLETLDANFRRLQEGHNELSGEVEMVPDAGEQIHYGLVDWYSLAGIHPFGTLSISSTRRPPSHVQSGESQPCD